MATATQIFSAVCTLHRMDVYPSAGRINTTLGRPKDQSLNGRECNIRRVCLDIFGIKLRKNQYK